MTNSFKNTDFISVFVCVIFSLFNIKHLHNNNICPQRTPHFQRAITYNITPRAWAAHIGCMKVWQIIMAEEKVIWYNVKTGDIIINLFISTYLPRITLSILVNCHL